MLDITHSFTVDIEPVKPDLLFETWTKHFGDIETNTRRPLVMSFRNDMQITCTPIWDTYSVLITNPLAHMIGGGYVAAEHTNIDVRHSFTFNLFYGVFETIFQFEEYSMIDEYLAYNLSAKIKQFGRCIENMDSLLRI